MKKKSFTILEIILVLIIISVIFTSFKRVFQIKNKDIAYGQTCIEYLYGQVRAYGDNAARGKGIRSGAALIYPDQFQIIFERFTSQTAGNQIIFKYLSGGTLYTGESLGLNEGKTRKRYCNTTNYTMVLTGTTSPKVFVNKGLKEDSNLQSFIISGTAAANPVTGLIDIYQYRAIGGVVQTGQASSQLGQFILDMRTQEIKKRICLYLPSTGGNCIQRDK